MWEDFTDNFPVSNSDSVSHVTSNTLTTAALAPTPKLTLRAECVENLTVVDSIFSLHNERLTLTRFLSSSEKSRVNWAVKLVFLHNESMKQIPLITLTAILSPTVPWTIQFVCHKDWLFLIWQVDSCRHFCRKEMLGVVFCLSLLLYVSSAQVCTQDYAGRPSPDVRKWIGFIT